MTDRELDAWLAEHLFGCEIKRIEGNLGAKWDDRAERAVWYECQNHGHWPHPWAVTPPQTQTWQIPGLSSTGDGMLLVLEAMRGKEEALVIDLTADLKEWHVSWRGDAVVETGQNLPLAVALAAKAALESARLAGLTKE